VICFVCEPVFLESKLGFFNIVWSSHILFFCSKKGKKVRRINNFELSKLFWIFGIERPKMI